MSGTVRTQVITEPERGQGVHTGVEEKIQDAWRVRILDGAGRVPRGAGVLLPGGRVLTCAHVVADALGLAPGEEPGGAGPTVDFPGSLAGGSCSAEVLPGGWAPPVGERGDVAVLRLLSAPPGDCAPAELHRCGDARARKVRAFGHPDDRTQGTWARAVLVGAGG